MITAKGRRPGTQRLLGIILAMSLLGVLLIASAVPVAAQKATISFWVDENPARTPAWREVMEEFNAEHPDIKVNFRALPDDEYDPVLRTAFTGGEPADLFVSSWKRMQLLQPLLDISDWVEEHKLRFIPGVWWATIDTVSGKITAIPRYVYAANHLFVDTDQMAEYGLSYDWAYWSDFVQAAEKIKARGVVPITLGQSGNWPGIHIWYPLLSRTVPADKLSNLYNEGGTATWTSPEAVKSAQLMRTMVEDGFFPEGFVGMGYADQKIIWYRQEAAFMISLTSVPGMVAVDAPEKNIDVVKWPPRFKDGEGSFETSVLHLVVTGVSGLTKYPEACLTLLEYITRAEIAGSVVEKTKLMSPIRGLDTEDLLGPVGSRTARLVSQAAGPALPPMETVLPTYVGEELIIGSLNKLLLGKETPAEFMQNIRDGLEDEGW